MYHYLDIPHAAAAAATQGERPEDLHQSTFFLYLAMFY